MAHTSSRLLTHFIFGTKGRRPHLEAELRERLFPYIGGILNELRTTPLAIKARTTSVADAMRVATDRFGVEGRGGGQEGQQRGLQACTHGTSSTPASRFARRAMTNSQSLRRLR